jgi:lipoprotein NlpI
LSITRTLIAALALAHGTVAHADAAADTPLLTYAMQQQFAAVPDDEASRTALARAEHALHVTQTPRENCARTIGAQRFAELWHDLGIARANRADHRGAIIALQRALDCLPRDIDMLASLAVERKWNGEYEAARKLLERALTIDAAVAGVRQQIGQIDFIQERWADAIGHYRYAATRHQDTADARYAEIMFHLAQRRAGVVRPEVLRRERRPADEDADGDEEIEWPAAILETLRGARTEKELLAAVLDDSSYPGTQERLCEALYYLGQEWLARGERETARRYFAAVVNTRVLYFIEHNLALIELRRMGAHSGGAAARASPAP